MPARHHTHHFRNALLMGALALLLPLLGIRLAYEWQGPFTADSPIYWAVGRGILNGLTPYRDLFETKPPGMFLVSALSLWLTGGLRLAAWLQTAALVTIPVAMVGGALSHHARRTAAGRALLAGCLGLLLALYTAERAGEFQVESFGAAFGCLAVWGMMRTLAHRSAGTAALLVAGFVGAIGMKEPFALTLVACGLVLAPDRSVLRRHTGSPLVHTAVIGMLALAALGYLEAYVGVYLREMLGSHVGAGEPLALRMLHADRLARDLWAYAPVLLIIIAFAWTALFAHEVSSARTRGAALAVCARHAGAVLLTSLAVGMGGAYFNHHFAFAVPVYAAVLLKVLHDAERWEPRRAGLLASGLAALCLLCAPALPSRDYRAETAFMQSDLARLRGNAEAIDALLDACGRERYLFLGANGTQLYGLTRHSPVGPFFFQYDYFVNGDRPAFAAAIEASIAEADIVVRAKAHAPGATPAVERALAEAFTAEPWPCAAGLSPDDGYETLFRRSVSPE